MTDKNNLPSEHIFSDIRVMIGRRITTLLGALLALAMSVSCNKPGAVQAVPEATADDPARSTSTPGSVEDAALKAATVRFEATWVKRGDWWYSVRGGSSAPRAFGIRGLSTSVRAEDPQSMVEPSPDVEWRGLVVFEGDQMRYAPLRDLKELQGSWSEWEPMPGQGAVYQVTKRNGLWEVENADDYAKPPDDADYLKEGN